MTSGTDASISPEAGDRQIVVSMPPSMNSS